MERIKIGTITKPQALKGQFRLKPEILNMNKLKKLNTIFIDAKSFSVESVTLRDAFAIFKVEGVNSCEDAEKLRNKVVFADLDIEIENHLDLQNFNVILNGENIGKVVDINNYGSKDILSVVGNRNFMLPVIDGLIIEMRENSSEVILNSEIFEQVVVYEN